MPNIDQIKCTNCGTVIKLTEKIMEAYRADMEKQFSDQWQKKTAVYEQQLIVAQNKIKMAEQTAYQKAQTDFGLLKQNMEAQIKEQTIKLDEARKNELSLMKKQRELEEKEKNMELEMTKKIEAERMLIIENARKKFYDEHHFKEAEKDKKMTDMQKTIEELNRKLEQGSQQTQGEVMELELENFLRNNFPFDVIEPVAKGVRGADVLQKVNNNFGQYCGTIVWESKRTKNWSEGWVSKLKDDLREIKGDVAVIVSERLPETIEDFGYYNGVWVCGYRAALGLATVLRMHLNNLQSIKTANVGKNEKMELLYSYLSGPEFRQKIEALVEAFYEMKSDLNKEKRVMEKIFAKRDKQIEKAIYSLTTMYGNMQGLIGNEMQDIPLLEHEEESAEKTASNNTDMNNGLFG